MKFNFNSFLITLVTVGFVNSSCDSDSEVTISSSSDFNNVKDCSSYKGNIKFEGSKVGNVNFSKLTKMEGDLTISDDKAITSISFPQLREFNGKLSITKLKSLSSLDFSKLSKIDELVLTDLEVLPSLKFSAGLSEAKKIQVARTLIQKAEGFNVDSLDSFDFTANVVLEKLELLKLTKVGKDFIFEANQIKASLNVPKLTKIGGKFIYTNSSSLGMPEIKEIGNVVHIATTSDTTFNFKNLERIGYSLTLTDNNKLKNASFPALAILEKDGLLIYNNPEMTELALPKLISIGGGFNISNPSIANLTLADTLNVKGAAAIFANISCSDFKSKYSGGVKVQKCSDSKGDKTLKSNEYEKGSTAESESMAYMNAPTIASLAITFASLFYIL